MGKRYIDADALISVIRKCGSNKNSFIDGLLMNGICLVIDAIPTAEVEEVKRGEWLYRQFLPPSNVGYQQIITCSNCAAKFARLYGVHFKYCPECGAKMDK